MNTIGIKCSPEEIAEFHATETPTLCSGCRVEIRQYGGDRYTDDLCERCYSKAGFFRANAIVAARAIKMRIV